jgi:hypothetical protein
MEDDEEEEEQDQGIIAAHTESGVNTADNRIAPKTKDGYRNAWNQMVKYSTEHGFGELKPPVGIDFVRAFFGSLSIPRDTKELPTLWRLFRVYQLQSLNSF